MSADPIRVDEVLVSERELWMDGPPHELFKQLRHECPVHWTAKITEYPQETGYWSVTRPEDVHEVSRDWATFSSERGGIPAADKGVLPAGARQGVFHGEGPAEARPPEGAVPARVHPQADRRARGGDPRDHRGGARPPRRARDRRPGLRR